MSRNKKILLGILTLLPILGIILYFISFIFMFASIGGMSGTEGNFNPDNEVPVAFLGTMGVAMISLLLTILISIALMIYYIIHVMNNKQLDKEKNEPIIWVLIILMAGMIGQFIYWYMKIWKEDSRQNDELI